MKKLFCFCLVVFVYVQGKTQDVTTAKWMQQPVVVDGNASEWGELNLYDDYTKLSFAIANDSDNIYLCFENSDEMNQMKMMRAGMKISLTAKGKNKHNVTIEFPLPQSKQTPQNQAAPTSQDSNENNISPAQRIHNTSSFRNNYIANHIIMNVSGFADVNGETSINNTNGIKAAINWDSTSNLFYEVAISKKEFYGTYYSPANDIGDITLSVEINGLKDAENLTQGNGGHHWQGGNGDGVAGGGMHGNRQFNNNSNQNNVGDNTNFQAQKQTLGIKTYFKQKFTLSTFKANG